MDGAHTTTKKFKVEVVFRVKGEATPSKSHIEVDEITPAAARTELTRLLKPFNRKVGHIYFVGEVRQNEVP